MKSKEDIATQAGKHIRETRQALSKQYENTAECFEFYEGDFMSYRDRVEGRRSARSGKENQGPMVQFNKVKPYINAVTGFFAQNRRKASYTAQVTDDQARQAYSDHVNAAADYIRYNANADHFETQQDKDMFICGYGAIDTCLSYGDGYASTDPNGEIMIGRLDPACVGWDASARAPNLIDAKYVWYKKEYDLQEAMDLLDAEKDDFEPTAPVQGEGRFNPDDGVYTKIYDDYDWSNRKAGRVNVYYYQWYEIENYWRASNPLFQMQDPQAMQFVMMQMEKIAGMSDEDSLFDMDPRAEILDVNAEQKKALSELFDGDIQFTRFKRKKFYGAVLSGKKVFSEFPLLSQQGFSIKFKTGDFHPSTGIWVGLINSMKEPVLYYNKFLSSLMYTIAAGSKGGLIVEDDAIADIQKFERNYTKTNGIAVVAAGGLAKIQPKAQPYMPNGLDSLMSIADQAIPETVGIDRAFFGSSERAEETATLQRQRIKQTMTVLACYADSIVLYSKEQARLMLDLIRALTEGNPGFMFLVTGQDGRQVMEAIDENKFAAEYYVTVQDAPETATEKEERASLLVGIGDKLLAIGDQSGKTLYGIAVQNMPIDMQTKAKILEVLMPNQQNPDPAYIQQLEQQVQQLQSEQAQAMLASTKATTRYTLAKAEEADANKQAKDASVVKTLAEADRLETETDIAKSTPQTSDNVNISI
jgi:hypothetical protein